MHTLRARLLVGTAAGTALVLLIFCITLYAIVSTSLWREFDDSLATKVRSLAALVERDEDGVQVELPPNSFPEFNPSARAEYFQLWSGDDVVASSASLSGTSLEKITGDFDVISYSVVTLPDGRRGRAAGFTFHPREEEEHEDGRVKRLGPPARATLVVARGVGETERALARLRLLLIGLCVVAILVAVGILARFVHRGLRPIDALAAQIAGVGESDLTGRIDARHIPAELMPVVQRLNELLARLEAAFNRERVLTADVAHELRTPLAGLRAMLEVALSRPRDSQSHRQTMTECLAVAQQMHQMTINLLHLARADARQLPIACEPVDIGSLIRECWKPLAAKAQERHLDIEWRVPEAGTLNTDGGKLQLVIANLLENAAAYCNPGGRVAIEAAIADDAATLSVTNTGSQVPADQVEHVFERFWRGDAARSVTGQHCGLGLSLCRKLVTLLGGSISAQSTLGGVFAVTVVLPALARDSHG